jgi:hypothetical protein
MDSQFSQMDQALGQMFGWPALKAEPVASGGIDRSLCSAQTQNPGCLNYQMTSSG